MALGTAAVEDVARDDRAVDAGDAAVASEPPLLDLQDLARDFGPVRAVDGLSLTVRRGEIVALLGPNGAGKSTTMKMIAGYLAPSRGRVLIDGTDAAVAPVQTRRRLGYLPEGAPTYPDMTPEGLLAFVARARGLGRADRHDRTEAVAEQLALGAVWRRPIGTLSTGFRRRVALAAALLPGPNLLVLDEPMDGLDPNQKHAVRAVLRGLDPAPALLLSTHILEEVEALCTRAVVIARGRVIEDDTPAALAARAETGRLDDVFRRLTAG